MSFQNLRIGMRLALGFGLLIAFTVLAIALAVLRFSQVAEVNTRIIEADWVKAEAAGVINATTRANARRTMELLIVSDAAQLVRVRARIAENKKTIDEALATLERLIYLPEGQQLLATLKTARGAYVASFGKVDKLVEAGDREGATRLMLSETLPALDALQGPIDRLAVLQKRIVVASSAEVQASIALSRRLLLLLGAASVAVAVAFAWWVTRSITRPLGEAVAIARRVAAGHLDNTVVARSQDECGQLLTALGEMNESLTHIVGRVRQGADTMATATSQIAAGNLDLSSRTEEQASALEQTSASMQELAQTVKQNYESGQHANRLAESASEVAVQGGAVVGRVVETMEAINDSSRRIADIIGVIDGIAFQTNILALNAAVEAARAGEQGRGFAVVASEVRNLAGRSATAAKEIKDLIGDSVANVSEGCKLVEQAGSTMDEIVVHVRRVADLMREITHASQDQTAGIDQISQAVGQMDQVTQQNAALVEEAAAAAQSLEHQAQQLVHAVSVFTLRGGLATPLRLTQA
ncbi:methyl-accepting chemotaxis protein [Hydrogenophaga sp. OTU3427]|uniref:methyl-accepting chemotaxis protein n=1 Tax=Hydrogenophaga sp. OTU3427 TaxID=3043856 RepID=UPI00313ED6BF